MKWNSNISIFHWGGEKWYLWGKLVYGKWHCIAAASASAFEMPAEENPCSVAAAGDTSVHCSATDQNGVSSSSFEKWVAQEERPLSLVAFDPALSGCLTSLIICFVMQDTFWLSACEWKARMSKIQGVVVGYQKSGLQCEESFED